MITVLFRHKRFYITVGIVMIVIAILFILYLGSSMLRSTATFWQDYT